MKASNFIRIVSKAVNSWNLSSPWTQEEGKENLKETKRGTQTEQSFAIKDQIELPRALNECKYFVKKIMKARGKNA